jgi:uncharacterized RDD family membrane protein YckC
MAGSDQLDTTIEVVTPENIAFEYRVAGPFRRYLAYLIDLLLRLLVFGVAASAISIMFGYVGLGGFGFALVLVLLFVIIWFYGPLLETYWNGQTVGKRILSLRVLTTDGQPINGLQAVLRNLLRSLDGQPFATYLLGVLAAMFNRRFQRLGDLACGTMVVMEDRSWHGGLTGIDDPAAVRLAGDLPAKFDVSRSLGKALAAYVERRPFFSPARRADIARHVGEPLRVKFGLPPDTNYDLLVCALYYRAFITDQDWDVSQAAAPATAPPVAPVPHNAISEAPLS